MVADPVKHHAKRFALFLVRAGIILGGALAILYIANEVVVVHKARLVQPLEFAETPYLHHGDHQASQEFSPGDVLYFHIKGNRRSACGQVISYRLVYTENGGRVIVFPWPMNIGYSVAGVYDSDGFFVLPKELPLGHYNFERYGLYYCGGEWVEQIMPGLPLLLVPKN